MELSNPTTLVSLSIHKYVCPPRALSQQCHSVGVDTYNSNVVNTFHSIDVDTYCAPEI